MRKLKGFLKIPNCFDKKTCIFFFVCFPKSSSFVLKTSLVISLTKLSLTMTSHLLESFHGLPGFYHIKILFSPGRLCTDSFYLSACRSSCTIPLLCIGSKTVTFCSMIGKANRLPLTTFDRLLWRFVTPSMGGKHIPELMSFLRDLV